MHTIAAAATTIATNTVDLLFYRPTIPQLIYTRLGPKVNYWIAEAGIFTVQMPSHRPTNSVKVANYP